MTHLARPPHVTLADHFADPEASRHPLGALFGVWAAAWPRPLWRAVLPKPDA